MCVRNSVFFLLGVSADLRIDFLTTQREVSLGMEMALMDIHLFYKRMDISELWSKWKLLK